MKTGKKLETGRIAAVVVLFHPSELVLQCIESYRLEVKRLYVFDNSPDQSAVIVKRIRQLDKIKYLTVGKNVGMAVALNIAAREAIDEGFEFLLTMDQDSEVTEGMLQRMLNCADVVTSAGMITPFHLDRNAPKSIPDVQTEDILVAMTSGCLLNLHAYKSVGGFMEKLFIDYVDTEYCLRLRTYGFAVVRCNKAILHHSLGRFTARNFLGRTVYPYNHSPQRLYYQTRNRFFLRRSYKNRFPGYFRYDLKLFGGSIVKILLYEEEPIRKLAMIVRGLFALWRNDFSVVPMS